MEGPRADYIRKIFLSTQECAFITYKFGPLVKSALKAQAELIDILKSVVLETIAVERMRLASFELKVKIT